MPTEERVERMIPSLKINSGLLLLKTGIVSNLPGKGRTGWETLIIWGSGDGAIAGVGVTMPGLGRVTGGGGITGIGMGMAWAKIRGRTNGNIMAGDTLIFGVKSFKAQAAIADPGKRLEDPSGDFFLNKIVSLDSAFRKNCSIFSE
jgi:hypothetical protein